MSRDESQIVKLVYNRFIESEEEIWTDLDDNLEMTGLMTNEELVKAAKTEANGHSSGIRCKQDHGQHNCMAPLILESVNYILDLYGKTRELHPKNRYILEFYLSMSALRMIYSG